MVELIITVCALLEGGIVCAPVQTPPLPSVSECSRLGKSIQADAMAAYEEQGMIATIIWGCKDHGEAATS